MLAARVFFLAISLLLLRRAEGSTCLTVELLKEKLAHYNEMALKKGIPAAALKCVSRAVDKIPRQEWTLQGKKLECVDEMEVGKVVGTSLAMCMKADAKGADAKRGNLVLKVPGRLPPKAETRARHLVPEKVDGAESVGPDNSSGAASIRTGTAQDSGGVKHAIRDADDRLIVQSPRRPVNAMNLLNVVSRGWDCNTEWCFCFCNSGCHYCCTLPGSGIPGQPGHKCWERVGCPPGTRYCL